MLDASHSSEGCTKSLWPPHSTYPPSNHSGTPSRLYRSKNLMDFVVRSRSAEAFHHTLNICHVAEIVPFTCAWNLTLCGLRVESTLARCYQIISISCPCLLLGVSLKYLCVYVLNLMLPFSYVRLVWVNMAMLTMHYESLLTRSRCRPHLISKPICSSTVGLWPQNRAWAADSAQFTRTNDNSWRALCESWV